MKKSLLLTLTLAAGLFAVSALPAVKAQSSYTITDLGTLGGSLSGAGSVNASGQVTGFAYTATGLSHAYLYTGGQMQDLGTLGGASSGGTGINTSSQIVGYADTANGYPHAFLYAGGKMHDLGTFGGFYSSAIGINR